MAQELSTLHFSEASDSNGAEVTCPLIVSDHAKHTVNTALPTPHLHPLGLSTKPLFLCGALKKCSKIFWGPKECTARVYWQPQQFKTH